MFSCCDQKFAGSVQLGTRLLAAGYEGGIRRECLHLDMIVATMLGFQGEKVSGV